MPQVKFPKHFMGTNTPWLAYRVKRLKRLWSAGLSAGYIADELGLTRNSIIGKVTRLKLGDHKTKRDKRANAVDLLEKRFGHLVVIARVPNDSHGTRWTARCDCGTLTTVTGSNLHAGRTSSCGCRRGYRHSHRRPWRQERQETQQ